MKHDYLKDSVTGKASLVIHPAKRLRVWTPAQNSRPVLEAGSPQAHVNWVKLHQETVSPDRTKRC